MWGPLASLQELWIFQLAVNVPIIWTVFVFDAGLDVFLSEVEAIVGFFGSGVIELVGSPAANAQLGPENDMPLMLTADS